MNKLLKNLNKQQQQAVCYNKGPLAIVAGAGSGKTRTITHKIAYMIEELDFNPLRILAVTFTNKASKEMKQRISMLIGESEGQRVKISTYHSLCARILREDIDKLQFKKKFNILDNIDQIQILRPGYKKFSASSKTISFSSVISFISKNKIQDNSPKQLKKQDNLKDIDKLLIDLYEYYIQETRRSQSLDFDDLLIFTNKLFKNHPEIAKKWSDKFDYVLVDEFQDTSYIQYEIMRSLAPHNNITVVGDPDQTIYTWRQADPRLIIEFSKHFNKSKTIILNENYRSTPEILNAANKLISKNKYRVKKELFTQNPSGEKIEYFHGFSEDSEARWVCQKINELRKNKTQLKDIVILFRANYLSASLEKSLITSNINYSLIGGVRFYQRQEVKDVIAFLKIINSFDEVSLKRMINIPSRKIGPTSIEKIEKMRLQSKEKTFWEFLINNFKNLPINKNSLKKLADFINLIRKYQIALKSNKISLVIDKFLIETGYLNIWSSSEDLGRLENIKELISLISQWETRNPEKKLADYLTEISLIIDRDEQKGVKDYVSLMTVHNSKGLEYDNVFIFGFSEGVFPSSRSIAENEKDGIEEERRVAYVAATRAKKKLFLSSSRGFSIDHKTQKKPSRFISELGLNIRDYTKEFIAPMNFADNYETNKTIIQGDNVSHKVFGIGKVIVVQGDIAEIAFKSPYGVKKMMKNHKSIVKVDM